MENRATPEVVILGIQSSGKTVCLSVLGRKYMIAGGSDRAEALGFRMEPINTVTRNVVIDACQKLEIREWPEPTKESDPTKLSWNVYTGRRHVFSLETMDCSGEDIRKAFAPGNDGGMVADVLLGTSETQAESRQREIRTAVFRAGLVCLFINVGTSCDEAVREEKRRNFAEAVKIFWSLLNDHPDIAKKSLVVLTQTHLLREEIQNAGGAFLYLGRRAPDLLQVVDRHQVPIICISAVNELNYDNKKPPETIESDGLFGFLLSVAGLVHDARPALLKLKNSYFAYLNTRNEVARHLRNRSPLPERVDALRSFARAAETFRNRCFRYVRKSANLAESVKELPFYEEATRKDAEIREASELWRDRLVIDEDWYDRLYSLVCKKMEGTHGTPVFTDEELRSLGDSIRKERELSPGLDAVLYGFEERISTEGSRLNSYSEWVKASAESLVSRIQYDEARKKMRAAISGALSALYLGCGWLLPWSRLWYVVGAVPFIFLFLFFLSRLNKKREESASKGKLTYYAETAKEKLGELAFLIRRVWTRLSLFCCKRLPDEVRKYMHSKTKAREIRADSERKPGAEKVITLPGGAEMRFRWCPPGTFEMGSPASEEGRSWDETLHRVTLTRGFWMADTPVTQRQWESVMKSNPARFQRMELSCFPVKDLVLSFLARDLRPVERVSWGDCQRFIQKVNEELGCGMRLPTEAEWEYACRAGTTGAYGGTGNLYEMGWFRDNSENKTHPVKQKKPNAWGLYDMHGNVWEWCADRYGGYPSSSVTNPTGSSSGDIRLRRGGSWSREASDCRTARRSCKPGDAPPADNQGFRVALVSVL